MNSFVVCHYQVIVPYADHIAMHDGETLCLLQSGKGPVLAPAMRHCAMLEPIPYMNLRQCVMSCSKILTLMLNEIALQTFIGVGWLYKCVFLLDIY